MTINKFFVEQTALNRTYREGPATINGDERISSRCFTYKSELGLVAGATMSILFTIDRPAKKVWPYFRDFNLWQPNHYYSGVVGDLEGKTFTLSPKADEPGTFTYDVVKSIPEFLIIFSQPVPPKDAKSNLPGLGGVSPGFQVFMLSEHAGKTTVSIYMDHASLAGTEDETAALQPWQQMMETNAHPKWRDQFIRDLKKLVYDGGNG